jgi:hypothetical protein
MPGLIAATSGGSSLERSMSAVHREDHVAGLSPRRRPGRLLDLAHERTARAGKLERVGERLVHFLDRHADAAALAWPVATSWFFTFIATSIGMANETLW